MAVAKQNSKQDTKTILPPSVIPANRMQLNYRNFTGNQLTKGNTPKIRWSVKAKSRPYQCCSSRCNLCLTEKFIILTAKKEDSLNKRSEILSKRRHKNKYKLRNFKPC